MRHMQILVQLSSSCPVLAVLSSVVSNENARDCPRQEQSISPPPPPCFRSNTQHTAAPQQASAQRLHRQKKKKNENGVLLREAHAAGVLNIIQEAISYTPPPDTRTTILRHQVLLNKRNAPSHPPTHPPHLTPHTPSPYRTTPTPLPRSAVATIANAWRLARSNTSKSACPRTYSGP